MRRWPPWRRHETTTAEAQAVLDRLAARAADVEALGVHLRELQEANHFSAMVRAAIARPREV